VKPAGALAARPAVAADLAAVARIYNEGIEDRGATFETELRRPEQLAGWLEGGYPFVVVLEGDAVVGFAAAFPYRSRPCYAGVREFSVYVARSHRGRGVGHAALDALHPAAAADGAWKLLSRVFVENEASRRLLRNCGYREVGVYEKHAKLDGQWRDCVIVERLLDIDGR
jgi:phosphinothricin acetyltransferase